MRAAAGGDSRWTRWLARPANERWLLLRASSLLVLTRCALRTIGFAALRKLLDAPVAPPDALRTEEAHLAAQSIESAARHLPFATTCLDRAVALCWMLRAEHLGGSLHIGVKKSGDRLAAHAWVERIGERLLDDGGGDFDSFDAALLGGHR